MENSVIDFFLVQFEKTFSILKGNDLEYMKMERPMETVEQNDQSMFKEKLKKGSTLKAALGEQLCLLAEVFHQMLYKRYKGLLKSVLILVKIHFRKHQNDEISQNELTEFKERCLGIQASLINSLGSVLNMFKQQNKHRTMMKRYYCVNYIKNIGC